MPIIEPFCFQKEKEKASTVSCFISIKGASSGNGRPPPKQGLACNQTVTWIHQAGGGSRREAQGHVRQGRGWYLGGFIALLSDRMCDLWSHYLRYGGESLMINFILFCGKFMAVTKNSMCGCVKCEAPVR